MAESTNHPTQKPEDLIRRLVQACSNKGDLVIDPFAGAGTTFAVCEKLERRWAGTEIEREYIDLIRLRLTGIAPNEKEHSRIYRQALDVSLSNRANDLIPYGNRPGRTDRLTADLRHNTCCLEPQAHRQRGGRSHRTAVELPIHGVDPSSSHSHANLPRSRSVHGLLDN
jgi:hypothetical protein